MGESFSITLGIGVISGLLASLLMIVIVKYWNSNVMPWFEKMVYKDVKIEGVWKTRIERADIDKIYEEKATIEQSAHRVKGHLTLIEDPDYEYEFKGEFRNLLLTAEYWRKKGNSRDKGTFTLELKDDGDLEGFYTGYSSSPIDKRVVTAVYKWNQIKP